MPPRGSAGQRARTDAVVAKPSAPRAAGVSTAHDLTLPFHPTIVLWPAGRCRGGYELVTYLPRHACTVPWRRRRENGRDKVAG
ncbi:hypothetical protein [Oryza sativa Japonica Group]|uniref:Uncharacterized protein n=1 Tax=Oryza sativa subsp. japonica TaxID=39947 RepID=Q8RZD2_ORYSJ|nr:hypothetical protein [Oryza sativa Japonica Group]